MSAYRPQEDRSSFVVAQGTQTLLRLLETKKPFVITNESLIALVQGLSVRLYQAVQQQKERDLLAFWDQNMALISQRLTALASEDNVTTREGDRLPLLNRHMVERLLAECPIPNLP